VSPAHRCGSRIFDPVSAARGLARRCDPVCVRDNGLRELVDLATLGSWERLLDDTGHVLGANAVDGAMQLAALCLVHLIPPVRHRFPEA